jgi:hypothetical protein
MDNKALKRKTLDENRYKWSSIMPRAAKAAIWRLIILEQREMPISISLAVQSSLKIGTFLCAAV